MGANWDENNKDYQKANARKHSMEYREAIRKYLHNYLLSHPCVSCVETEPIVSESHHRHGKEMAIAQMMTRVKSIERIKEELKKIRFYALTVLGS